MGDTDRFHRSCTGNARSTRQASVYRYPYPKIRFRSVVAFGADDLGGVGPLDILPATIHLSAQVNSIRVGLSRRPIASAYRLESQLFPTVGD